MSKFIDLTGKQFGDLEVLEFLGNRRWKCRCKCGKILEMTSYGIRKTPDRKCNHINNDGTTKYTDDDITGMKFNEWTVLEFAGNKKWKCQCSCGNIRYLTKLDITTGRSKSCGHVTQNQFKDITGVRFGKLIALRYLGNGYWECKCDCGDIQPYLGYNLRRGRTTSCGHRGSDVIDITNNKYGMLTPIKYIGNSQWECKCDCGNTCIVYRQSLLNGTSSCGCNRLNKMQNTLLIKYGDINPNKIDRPREDWQIDAIRNENNLRDIIQRFNLINARKATTDDLMHLLDINRSSILNYIHKYKLEELIDLESIGSYHEQEIFDIITNNYSGEVERHNRTILGGKEIDIYIPEKGIAIEFNGSYWHSDKLKDRYYHRNKTLGCHNKGIRLITIFDYEWKDTLKNYLISNMIVSLLRDSEDTIINYHITEIDSELAYSFEQCNHIDGAVHSHINIGLLDEVDNLIGVMSFSRLDDIADYEFELNRFCIKQNFNVTGWKQRLFEYFIYNYNPNSVISYCNISKYSENDYIDLGFKHNGYSEPDYVLYEENTGKIYTKEQLVENVNYLRVYDCGSSIYIWNKLG